MPVTLSEAKGLYFMTSHMPDNAIQEQQIHERFFASLRMTILNCSEGAPTWVYKGAPQVKFCNPDDLIGKEAFEGGSWHVSLFDMQY